MLPPVADALLAEAALRQPGSARSLGSALGSATPCCHHGTMSWPIFAAETAEDLPGELLACAGAAEA